MNGRFYLLHVLSYKKEWGRYHMEDKEKIKVRPPRNPNKRDCIAKNITFSSQIEMEKIIRLLAR